ncbi:hypothetical protein T492DRAFT_1144515 [Pavlovales sp. CCMP2436]|nr:hypothetical protein T492DRAFT_1144515 [Pavlovales sp. CCMP2436]
MATESRGLALFAQGRDGAQLLSCATPLAPLEGGPNVSSLHSVIFSPDGRYMAALDSSAANGGAVVFGVGGAWPLLLRVSRPVVTAVAFSPLATFVVTWEKLTEESDGNLLVHRLSDGAVASRLKQKTFTRDKWPSTPWSADESLCAQMATGEVQFFDGTKGPGASPPIARLKLPHIQKFKMAPSALPAQRIATFVPEQLSPRPQLFYGKLQTLSDGLCARLAVVPMPTCTLPPCPPMCPHWCPAPFTAGYLRMTREKIKSAFAEEQISVVTDASPAHCPAL